MVSGRGALGALTRKVLPLLAALAACLTVSPPAGAADPGSPKGALTLAVAPFANHSGDPRFGPLGKGLAEMLITDLQQVKSLQIVERERIQSLIDELALADTGFLDPSTAQRMGRGLGARYLLTGAFVALSPEVRIDARIVEVETGRVLTSEAVAGPEGDFFVLQKELASRIVAGLKAPLTAREDVLLNRVSTESFEAVVAFSRALDALDAGALDDARRALADALSIDQGFAAARDRLAMLESRLERLRKERAESLAATLDGLIATLEARIAAGGPVEDVPDLIAARLAELSLPRSARKARRVCRAVLDLSVPDDVPLARGAPASGSLNGWALAQMVLTSQWLKDDAAVLTYGEPFLRRHPGSAWSVAVDLAVSASIQRQRDIASGQARAAAEVAREDFRNLKSLFSLAGSAVSPREALDLWPAVEDAARRAGEPLDPDALEAWAVALLRAGDVSAARGVLERLTREAAGSDAERDVLSRIGRWEHEQARIEGGRSRYEEDPGPDTAAGLADLLASAGRCPDALRVAREARVRYAGTLTPFYAGRLYRPELDCPAEAGDWEAAVAAAAAWEEGGAASGYDAATARRIREQAERLPAQYRDLRAMSAYLRGARLRELRQDAEAARAFEEYARTAPDGASVGVDTALYMAGAAWQEAGRFAEARAAYLGLKERFPDSTMARSVDAMLSMLPDDE